MAGQLRVVFGSILSTKTEVSVQMFNALEDQCNLTVLFLNQTVLLVCDGSDGRKDASSSMVKMFVRVLRSIGD